MTLRQEIFDCIEEIPENKLLALRPLLYALVDDAIVIETNLTGEERGIIAEGMAEYRTNPESFVPLSKVQ